MRTRGQARWPVAVAGLAALTLTLGLASGPHRAGALLRGLPRTAAMIGHAADAKGLPVGHRAGKVSAASATVDAALTPALLGVEMAAAVVAVAALRRRRALPLRSPRPRAPPARH